MSSVSNIHEEFDR